MNVRGKAVVRGGRCEPRRRTRVNHRRRVVKPGDIRTGALMLSWDKPEGNLFTALAVSGMKVARAWFGLCSGTGELLGVTRVPVDWCGCSPGGRQVANTASRRVPGACQEGGTSRSSAEALVMGVERRGRVVVCRPAINQVLGGIAWARQDQRGSRLTFRRS